MIAVTGANGQLGSAFRRLLGADTVPLTRADLDLSDVGSIAAVLDEVRPSTLINCAAYTAVDRAEDDASTARTVNADAVGEMARWTARAGARFVTFSTDYVFDGTKRGPYVESDPTRPINVYGATKRQGEIAALEADPQALVVRTSWVLSGTHPNFVATMVHLARERTLKVVDDQRGHPTLVDDLAPATLEAIRAGATGVLHLANAGVTTWYGLAREAVALAGLDPARIEPCTTDEYPTRAARPRNSVLESERIAELGLRPMPHYRSGLARIVAELVPDRS